MTEDNRTGQDCNDQALRRGPTLQEIILAPLALSEDVSSLTLFPEIFDVDHRQSGLNRVQTTSPLPPPPPPPTASAIESSRILGLEDDYHVDDDRELRQAVVEMATITADVEEEEEIIPDQWDEAEIRRHRAIVQNIREQHCGLRQKLLTYDRSRRCLEREARSKSKSKRIKPIRAPAPKSRRHRSPPPPLPLSSLSSRNDHVAAIRCQSSTNDIEHYYHFLRYTFWFNLIVCASLCIVALVLDQVYHYYPRFGIGSWSPYYSHQDEKDIDQNIVATTAATVYQKLSVQIVFHENLFLSAPPSSSSSSNKGSIFECRNFANNFTLFTRSLNGYREPVYEEPKRNYRLSFAYVCIVSLIFISGYFVMRKLKQYAKIDSHRAPYSSSRCGDHAKIQAKFSWILFAGWDYGMIADEEVTTPPAPAASVVANFSTKSIEKKRTSQIRSLKRAIKKEECRRRRRNNLCRNANTNLSNNNNNIGVISEHHHLCGWRKWITLVIVNLCVLSIFCATAYGFVKICGGNDVDRSTRIDKSMRCGDEPESSTTNRLTLIASQSWLDSWSPQDYYHYTNDSEINRNDQQTANDTDRSESPRQPTQLSTDDVARFGGGLICKLETI